MKQPLPDGEERVGRPLRASAPPTDATSPTTARARVRWADEGESTEIDLDGERGLVVVPVTRDGAERASMLVEALDRAAPGGRRRVQISRKHLTLELHVPEDWPPASRLPSIVLGSGTRPDQSGAVETSEGRPLPPVDPSALDERSAALIREYPRRRRALAAQRRGVEADLVRLDDHVRSRRRAGSYLVLGAGVALLTGFAGAATSIPLLALLGALAFVLLSAGYAWERQTRTAIVGRRGALEARLGRIADWEQQLDARARDVARELGCADPWEAAARAQAPPVSTITPKETAAERKLVLSRAAALARALGLDASRFDWDEAWDTPPPSGGKGWPAEVAASEADLAGPGHLLRVARLLARADRFLPAVWPVVLFDPWTNHEARERARMLLAVAEVARPRPVVALVGSSS